MKHKKFISLTTLVLLTASAFIAWNLAVPISANESLVAYKTSDTFKLDGLATEKFWENSTLLILEDYGQDLSSGIEGSDVQIRFMHNGTHIFVFLEWTDPTESNTRKGWIMNTTDYDNLGGNEDRITLAWSVGGAAIICGHNPAGDDTTMLFDIWHWKASRTAPAGWVDDKNWDGTGRNSDSKTSGGYKDNSVVAQAADVAEINSKLGNSTVVSSFSDDDLPYWFENGTEIPWVAGIVTGDLPDFIPGYITSIPVGSRGDVLAASLNTGKSWQLEEIRKFDTGNPDDIKFEVGKDYTFYLAVHDNSHDDEHFKEENNALTVTISPDQVEAPKTIKIPTTIEKTNEKTVTTTVTEAGFSFIALSFLTLSAVFILAYVTKRKR